MCTMFFIFLIVKKKLLFIGTLVDMGCVVMFGTHKLLLLMLLT
jgi:hypothetical protein